MIIPHHYMETLHAGFCVFFVPRCLDLREDGCVVDMHQFNSGSQSVLAYATVNGSLVGWDLRSSSNAWTLKHDLRLGLITSFAVDIHQCWLCIGKLYYVYILSFTLSFYNIAYFLIQS